MRCACCINSRCAESDPGLCCRYGLLPPSFSEGELLAGLLPSSEQIRNGASLLWKARRSRTSTVFDPSLEEGLHESQKEALTAYRDALRLKTPTWAYVKVTPRLNWSLDKTSSIDQPTKRYSGLFRSPLRLMQSVVNLRQETGDRHELSSRTDNSSDAGINAPFRRRRLHRTGVKRAQDQAHTPNSFGNEEGLSLRVLRRKLLEDSLPLPLQRVREHVLSSTLHRIAQRISIKRTETIAPGELPVSLFRVCSFQGV